jgi:transcriptional regulator with XRE-family HTH domain
MRGLSQRALADKVGVIWNFMTYLEGGKKKGSLSTYTAIARELGVSLPSLLHDGDPSPKHEDLVSVEGLTKSEVRAVRHIIQAFRKGKL